MRDAAAVLDTDKEQSFPVELYRAGIKDRIHGMLPMLALQNRISLVPTEELLLDFHIRARLCLDENLQIREQGQSLAVPSFVARRQFRLSRRRKRPNFVRYRLVVMAMPMMHEEVHQRTDKKQRVGQKPEDVRPVLTPEVE
jgi:hypothetical protein